MNANFYITFRHNLKLKPMTESIQIAFTLSPFSKVLFSDGCIVFGVRDFFFNSLKPTKEGMTVTILTVFISPFLSQTSAFRYFYNL